MAAYLGFLLLAGVQSFLVYNKIKFCGRQFGAREYVILCCVELILLAGLRGYTIGADTSVYLDALEYYSSLPRKDILFAKLVYQFDFEPGYFLFTKICAFLQMSKTIFLLIVAIVIYVPIFHSMYSYSPIPYISILSYFALGMFSYSLGIFRQMMAISMVLCGMKFVEERRLVPYLFLVLLAATFHITAIVMIAIYVLYDFRIEVFVKWIIPVEFICMMFGRPMILVAMRIFPQFSHYLGGEYDIRGGSYLMLLLLNLLLFARLYMNMKGLTRRKMDIVALTCGIGVQCIGYSMALFGRLVPYFSIFAIFSISEIAYAMMYKTDIYEVIKHDICMLCKKCIALKIKYAISRQAIIWGFFIGVLLLLTLKNMVGNQYILPYRFFFAK